LSVQIDRYTEVLMGAVELARVMVPEDTLDSSIDLATRQFLFRYTQFLNIIEWRTFPLL
jgi:hypothetical protein